MAAAAIASLIAILVTILTGHLDECNARRPTTTEEQKFPAVLIFGDSTVDTGNNNYIKTYIRSNYRPYGRDFPGHVPTGRFSNGKLFPDLVAEKLGIKELVPPFLKPDLSDDDVVTGVSFASAGSGYDDLTSVLSSVITVSKQVDMFRNYTARLEGIVGEEKAEEIVGSALVIISAGTNDWVINFYDIPIRTLRFNVTEYQDFLLAKVQNFVKELYDLGCRKIVVSGLPPIGCLPIEMTIKYKSLFHRECVEDQNSDPQAYNEKLVELLDQLESSLPGSKIAYADVYEPLFDMSNDPKKYGFVETKRGCCGTGLLEASFLCNPGTPTCKDPSKFMFWDSIHPTEATYKYLAESIEKDFLPKLLED